MTGTVTVTKTVVCPLQTSNRKNSLVDEAIDDFQEVAAHAATMMPSVEEHMWGKNHQQQNRFAMREFDGLDIFAHDRNEAVGKVSEAFKSWRKNGKPSAESPKGEFGQGDYLRMCSCCSSPDDGLTETTGRYTVRENGGGYALRLKFHRDGAEWFRVYSRPYVDEHLADLVRGEASLGCVELHRSDGGRLDAHVALSYDIPVPEVGDVPRAVGVDLGERRIYAAVAVGADGEKLSVDVESGREFRHHRQRLKRKRRQLSKAGDLRGVEACQGELRRYTDHVTHVTSRQVVDLAVKHAPCVLRLERLRGYRSSADPIHDWPFAEMLTKMAYKAAEEGIPVETVEAAGTSQRCSRCGEAHRTRRGGNRFECHDCGYDQDADVNAAVNIGTTA